MAVDAPPRSQSLLHYRLARVLAEILAPAVLVAGIMITIALASSSTLLSALLWAAVSTIFCSVFPIWYMARGAKAGKWDTHHVRNRADRFLPLAVSIGSVLLGLLILILGGAPTAVIALVVAMLGLLVIATAITQAWKISLHAAIAAGVVAVLATTFGPLWWCALVAVALVSWSRVHTDDHTLLQVLAGSALGILTCGGLYLSLL